MQREKQPVEEKSDADEPIDGSTGKQRTVTIGRAAYAILTSAYEKNKVKLLERENIRTLTEYARARLLRGVEEDILEGRFEIVGRDDSTLAVMDYYEQVKVEVVFQRGGEEEGTMEVYCRHDRSGDCDHVGFVLADVEVIKRAQEMGVVLRKAGPPEEFREALRVFDILSDASEEGLVGEDAFVRALVRDGELTKKGAKAMVQKLYETNEIYEAKRGHYKRAGASRGKREKPRMPVEQRQ